MATEVAPVVAPAFVVMLRVCDASGVGFEVLEAFVLLWFWGE